ncbi:MAG: phosphoribosylformylglycinamidine cyclo-ligase [candidate division WOR-3 bacterium]
MPILYKDAGVDIDRLNILKREIGKKVKKTFSPAVLSEIGLFGSLYQLSGYKEPVLVSSVDGVGTKLLIAQMMERHNTVGEDLVNHSVNDILTLGAKPLFFLDYIAFSEIEDKVLKEIFFGLRRACQKNKVSLVGGETAQMPGIYPKGVYDLVGFIVGVVEKKKMITGKKIKEGDLVLGLPSNGLHTNGYSLARKILLEEKKFRLDESPFPLKNELGDELLRVHKSYLKEVSPFLSLIKGIAHITGGGFYENIKRILPEGVSVFIKKGSWQIPEIFRLIQDAGSIPDEEMYRVFNMGIGMVLFVAKENLRRIKSKGLKVIGEVKKGKREVVIE